MQAAAQAASRDLSVISAAASTTPPALAPVSSPQAFFQTTAYTTQQTPPTTPLSVTTAVTSHDQPLFTISDHFVNTSVSGSFATVNGNANTLTSIQGRQKMNENLVVSFLFALERRSEIAKLLNAFIIFREPCSEVNKALTILKNDNWRPSDSFTYYI